MNRMMRWAAWRYLLDLYGRTPRLLAASLLAAAGQSALLVSTAPAMRSIFDTAIPSGDAVQLRALCALLLALIAGSAALSHFVRIGVGRIGKRAVETLRGDLLWRLFTAPRDRYAIADQSALHTMLTSDTERIDTLGYALLAQLIPAALVGVPLAGVLLAINPILFGVFCIALPATVLLGRLLAARMSAAARSYHGEFTELSRSALLAVQRRDALQSFSVDPVIADRHSALAASLRTLGERWVRASSGYQFANQIGLAVAVLVVLLAGGEFVIRGHLTLGELAAFFVLAVLLRDRINLVLGAFPQIIAGGEALARTHGWIASSSVDPYQAGTRRVSDPKCLRLDAASFSYAGRPVLREIALDLRRGETMVLRGSNGAGKTTLALLLLGLHRPTAGHVLVDGDPYEAVDLRSLRTHIAYVPQDPVLFDATIEENIRFLRPDIPPEAVAEAQRLAGLDEFLEALPAGARTRVGEAGILLSGGQRQRIALARALAGRPGFLIFDEPTAHLDVSAARAILSRMRILQWRPGILLITHDVDPAIGAQAQWLLDGGVLRPDRASPVSAIA